MPVYRIHVAHSARFTAWAGYTPPTTSSAFAIIVTATSQPTATTVTSPATTIIVTAMSPLTAKTVTYSRFL